MKVIICTQVLQYVWRSARLLGNEGNLFSRHGALWLNEVLKISCVMVLTSKIHGDISPGKDAPTRAQLLCLYDDMQIVNLN
jgi:hypothetical protein